MIFVHLIERSARLLHLVVQDCQALLGGMEFCDVPGESHFLLLDRGAGLLFIDQQRLESFNGLGTVSRDPVEVHQTDRDIRPDLGRQGNGRDARARAHVGLDGMEDRVIAGGPQLRPRQRKRLILGVEIGSDVAKGSLLAGDPGLDREELRAERRERREDFIHPRLRRLDLAGERAPAGRHRVDLAAQRLDALLDVLEIAGKIVIGRGRRHDDEQQNQGQTGSEETARACHVRRYLWTVRLRPLPIRPASTPNTRTSAPCE